MPNAPRITVNSLSPEPDVFADLTRIISSPTCRYEPKSNLLVVPIPAFGRDISSEVPVVTSAPRLNVSLS